MLLMSVKNKNIRQNEDSVKPLLWWGLIILATAGIAIGIYLTYVHYKAGGAACDVNRTFSCSEVVTSKWSEIFHIPISWLGVLTYLGVIVLAFLGKYTPDNRVGAHSPLYIFLISIWCVVYSLFLAGVTAFVLKVYCPNCIALYFVNLGLLLCSWRWVKVIEADKIALLIEDIKWGIKNIWAWAAVSIIAVVLAGSYAFFVSIQPSSGIVNAKFRNVDLKDFPSKGHSHAPVQIVEFTDLKCPWCKETHQILENGRAKYGDKYIVFLIHFPLDGECNEKVVHTIHPGACKGAYASYCAQQQGKFWEYTDYLFERQNEMWTEETLVGYAKELGLSENKFRECLSAPSTKEFIQKNIKIGLEVPINHTPTLFFNGEEIGQISRLGVPGLVMYLQKAMSKRAQTSQSGK